MKPDNLVIGQSKCMILLWFSKKEKANPAIGEWGGNAIISNVNWFQKPIGEKLESEAFGGNYS